MFEALRVDITSKGKIRARRVNFLQPNLVKTVNYPLEFRERGQPSYFQKREQWRLTDFLFNPMVVLFVIFKNVHVLLALINGKTGGSLFFLPSILQITKV